MEVLKQENGILPEYDQTEEKAPHSLISQEMRKIAD